MRRIFAFNGDADGLCALQQLRLAEGRGACELVTGPKRRTALLAGIAADAGDEITVLDVSFHANREAVERLLAAGARLRYFDHHHAGAPLVHERLETHIDLAPHTCTSAIVDRHLGGSHRVWAAVGAFGDNLPDTARGLAARLEMSATDLDLLERLGVLLNYNSYGESEEDLLFAPAALHARLVGYADPLEFMRADPAYPSLARAYAEDMRRADGLKPLAADDCAALYMLPDASWARRVSGVLANRLARAAPERAHAVLSRTASGAIQVSVRAPLERATSASALCLAYPTGGGRDAAAGINDLPAADVARFTEHFLMHFAR